MIAHVATNSQVLWYPFVALALPALIIVSLTIYDRTGGLGSSRRGRWLAGELVQQGLEERVEQVGDQ